MAAIRSDELRQAMRLWATGVTIVTVRSRGVKHGMTVSSFTSVSLDPPTVSISLEQNTRTHELITEAGAFGITFLSSEQQSLSERFAGQIGDRMDRFEGLETWILETGAPFLNGGLAYLDCKVHSMQPFGSNTLIIGGVVAAKTGNGRSPLLYFDRMYRRLQE
jgi:flavin reductase (DIM6/NTAB) family NADH-FMN oxidoreductase RutF